VNELSLLEIDAHVCDPLRFVHCGFPAEEEQIPLLQVLELLPRIDCFAHAGLLVCIPVQFQTVQPERYFCKAGTIHAFR
jgi:hypothetical protein